MEEVKAFLRSREPVNLTIVLVNIAVFVLLSLQGNTESGAFLLKFGAMYPPFITEKQEYYRLFTCMFLHFGLEHLIFNMMMLIFLGDTLEKTVGKIRYLMIYAGGGLIGNLLSLSVSLRTGDNPISAGASGAIFAVVGALIFFAVFQKGRIRGLSADRLILMAVLNVVNGVTSSGIDNEAHVGGLAAGFVLMAVLDFCGHCFYNKK